MIYLRSTIAVAPVISTTYDYSEFSQRSLGFQIEIALLRLLLTHLSKRLPAAWSFKRLSFQLDGAKMVTLLTRLAFELDRGVSRLCEFV